MTQAHLSPRQGVGSLRTRRGPNVTWCCGDVRPSQHHAGSTTDQGVCRWLDRITVAHTPGRRHGCERGRKPTRPPGAVGVEAWLDPATHGPPATSSTGRSAGGCAPSTRAVTSRLAPGSATHLERSEPQCSGESRHTRRFLGGQGAGRRPRPLPRFVWRKILTVGAARGSIVYGRNEDL